MQIFVNALPWILCIIINIFLLTQWIAGRRVGVGGMYIAVYDKHVKLGDQPPLALAIISFLSTCWSLPMTCTIALSSYMYSWKCRVHVLTTVPINT